MNSDNDRPVESPNKNSIGYKLGQATTMLIGICIMAIIVALTIKIIQWLL